MKYLLWGVFGLGLLGSTAVVAQYVDASHEAGLATAHRSVAGRDASDDQPRYIDQEQNNGGVAGSQGFNAQIGRDPRWSPGDVLSSDRLAARYIVSDWQSHHLHSPPDGYHWVRLDDKFALVAIGGDTVAEIAGDGR